MTPSLSRLELLPSGVGPRRCKLQLATWKSHERYDAKVLRRMYPRRAVRVYYKKDTNETIEQRPTQKSTKIINILNIYMLKVLMLYYQIFLIYYHNMHAKKILVLLQLIYYYIFVNIVLKIVPKGAKVFKRKFIYKYVVVGALLFF